MEEFKVNTIVISKQNEESDNYKYFKQLVKDKKIKILFVNKGDKLNIEKDVYINILWPNKEKVISDNILNNNSVVCKLVYKDFSILFTGDIEEIAEKEILDEYKNNLKMLNSIVLKVAHHGSNTSSTNIFLEAVKPKIALIGVGKDNKFGHPNDEIIERLKQIKTKIYRTDNSGEITIVIDKNGRIKIREFIK